MNGIKVEIKLGNFHCDDNGYHSEDIKILEVVRISTMNDLKEIDAQLKAEMHRLIDERIEFINHMIKENG